MSNNVNQNLLERAVELIDEYSDTTAGKMLIRAVESNDLEKVYEIVRELEAMEYENESRG